MTETTARLSVFLGVLILMSVAEAMIPEKTRTQPRGRRWLTNFGMVVVDTVALRILFPIIAVGAAVWAQESGIGLFNYLQIPAWIAGLASVILLDLAIYWQHVASHKFPILWRLHQVHHVDRDLDASTGLRFHPIEIVLSMLYKMAVVIALGAPPLAVIIFEIALNAFALFNHANIRILPAVEKPLRLILITPELHRIHHSTKERETNSNYGFSVSWWDRLFRSLTAQPEGLLTLGLSEHQSDKPSGLMWSLLLPFKRRA